MWFLVHVVKGSKHFEQGSLVGNRVLISDTTDMVISARANGTGYRFEARKGIETFIVRDFSGPQPEGTLASSFSALAQQVGAHALTGES